MEGVLVLSTSRGRYAVGTPDGPDLTTGDRVAVKLAGTWVSGSIEHMPRLYVPGDTAYGFVAGYCFVAQDGSRCGLCAGMEVRLL